MPRSTLALCGLLLVPALAPGLLPRPALPFAVRDDGQRRLLWTARLPTPAPAWPDQPRLPFDRAPRPLLHGGRVYHGCTRTDAVVCRDRATGVVLWRAGTDGPVRLPLAVWSDPLRGGDLVYAASDDGHLYALDAETGEPRWRARGGPSDRKLLGNERLVSAWPARGGPVVVPEADGRATVYFGAGIWPFMGIFLHALDAETGRVVWTTDGEGARYMKQPHNADSFAGVAPQGSFVVPRGATGPGDTLLVPGGRSVPAAFDRRTGAFVHYRLAENGKVGGSEVQADGPVFLCGGAAFSTATGDPLGKYGEPCHLAGGRLYCWEKGRLVEYDTAGVPIRREATTDVKGKPIIAHVWEPRRRAAVALPATPLALCRHGDRLFVALPDKVVALRLPLTDGAAEVVWAERLAEPPVGLVADADGVAVVGKAGTLSVFGFAPPRGIATSPTSATVLRPTETDPADAARTRDLLAATGQRAGYALVAGAANAGLARELVRQSDLRVVLAVADADDVTALREEAHAAGVYGERLTILPGTPATLDLPPYFASLVVLDDAPDEARASAWVRPYGGALVRPDGTVAVRAGALPGAGNWTHEQGDAAGSRTSGDAIVKAPLGLLWFGGPTSEDILPRHGHGPQPHVIDGRAIIEGMDLLRAIDIYTGRLLWEAKLPGVGKVYDNTAHQPGANACGGNYVSLPHGVYVAHGSACVRLDPATGKEVGRYPVPRLPGVPAGAPWSYINVVDDYLVGGTLPDNPGTVAKPAAPASSKVLFVLDRNTGKLLWSAKATNDGWRHNAVCLGGGKLYAVDQHTPRAGFTKEETDKLQEKLRLVAFDLATGKEAWKATKGVFGTNLAYSVERDVLIEAGRVARDTLHNEPKGMRAYAGATGKVLWFQPEYGGPCMLLGDRVLFGSNASGKACNLLTGKAVVREDPLTGEPVEWTWARHYGCNTPMASEHLITFRSGSAGFYDLCHAGGDWPGIGGTGNLGGFRSGCTNNLVVAGGVLVVPDYTRTCTCSYQNQCSVALVPMPDADLWTFQGGSSTVNGVVRRCGVLLGAPGNRKADDGTLWLEHPSSGSPGPKLDIEVTPKPTYFRRHPSGVQGSPAWVGASGAVGVETVRIKLGPSSTPERRCTVRLYFVEPEDCEPGERIFAVAINGATVLPALDVRAEAGAAMKLVVKEFAGVAVADRLEVRLTPADRDVPAVLCGVEVVQE